MAKKYLDNTGLTHLWDEKIVPLATLQNPLVVKNPRVQVSDEVKDHTFPAGSNIEDVLNYLYRNVIAEANPNHPVSLPTITTSYRVATATADNTAGYAELNSTVNYTIKKGTFNPGTIGTCLGPNWESTPVQGDVASGSDSQDATFKIYSGTTSTPSECTTEPTMVSGQVTGSITVSSVGDNYASNYYCSTIGYTESDATSYTSYGNPLGTEEHPHVSGVSYFPGSTTQKSSCVRCKVIGYKPSFGDVKLSSSTTGESSIVNLGNKINKAGSQEFWYGAVDMNTATAAGSRYSWHIYFPNDRTLSKIEWFDEKAGNIWVDMTNDVEVSSSTYFANLPAGSDTSKYPDKGLVSGTEYKEVHVKLGEGNAWGARHYRITLS